MVFTINRYLFAALLIVIGADILLVESGSKLDPGGIALALAYFAGALGILNVFKKGSAVDCWKMLLESNPKLGVFLPVTLSIVQVSLWLQVISIIKTGQVSGLDAMETNALKMVQLVLPFLVVIAVPILLLVNKLKNELITQTVAKCSATISDSKDKAILCEQLHKLIAIERYRKNMVMAEIHSKRLMALVEERTHKVKRMSRPKSKHAQGRKHG
ncbi:MAG: hypothetical protein KIT34_05025 [Cyanobacteria bacterium TGS_CYA1]|nr:hypothetical protein [Cyanobacteria bacterium TGS_CYA1]